MLLRFVLVGIGSGLGGMARYATALALPPMSFFPGTLAVNLIGSFALGVVVRLSVGQVLSPGLAIFLGTGVMGGFTTYSTFNEETLGALRNAQPLLAALYVGLTLVACLGAGSLGHWLAGRF